MDYVNLLRDLGFIVGIPVVRSAAGWLSKSLEDNKITKFELKLLASTIVRVGSLGLMAYFGLTVAGVDNAAITASIGAFFADKLFKSLKENKSVK